MRPMRSTMFLVSMMLLAACAVRLGGPKAEEYSSLAFAAGADETAAQAAARIREVDAQLVLLSAPHDTAWFQSVATETGLALSGPGRTGPTSLAFFAPLEILGDTSLVLSVPEGGRIHMHDALYKVDKSRFLDLMIVRFDSTHDLRAAVRTLFGYIATEVGANAALLLAIEAATPQAADSVATLMHATLGSAVECANGNDSTHVTPPLQLLYGPSARLGCSSARVLTTNAIHARVVVER